MNKTGILAHIYVNNAVQCMIASVSGRMSAQERVLLTYKRFLKLATSCRRTMDKTGILHLYM